MEAGPTMRTASRVVLPSCDVVLVKGSRAVEMEKIVAVMSQEG